MKFKIVLFLLFLNFTTFSQIDFYVALNANRTLLSDEPGYYTTVNNTNKFGANITSGINIKLADKTFLNLGIDLSMIRFKSDGTYPVISLEEIWGNYNNDGYINDDDPRGDGILVEGVDENGDPYSEYIDATSYFNQFSLNDYFTGDIADSDKIGESHLFNIGLAADLEISLTDIISVRAGISPKYSFHNKVYFLTFTDTGLEVLPEKVEFLEKFQLYGLLSTDIRLYKGLKLSVNYEHGLTPVYKSGETDILFIKLINLGLKYTF